MWNKETNVHENDCSFDQETFPHSTSYQWFDQIRSDENFSFAEDSVDGSYLIKINKMISSLDSFIERRQHSIASTNFNTKENDMIIVIDCVCTNPFDTINLESSHCYVDQINICAWRTNQWMIHYRTDQSVNAWWWWWTTTTDSKLSRQDLFLSSIEEHSFITFPTHPHSFE